VPAPAVIPAPIAYTKVVAVKKLVVRYQVCGEGSIQLSNMNFGLYCFDGAEGLFDPNPLWHMCFLFLFKSRSKQLASGRLRPIRHIP